MQATPITYFDMGMGKLFVWSLVAVALGAILYLAARRSSILGIAVGLLSTTGLYWLVRGMGPDTQAGFVVLLFVVIAPLIIGLLKVPWSHVKDWMAKIGVKVPLLMGWGLVMPSVLFDFISTRGISMRSLMLIGQWAIISLLVHTLTWMKHSRNWRGHPFFSSRFCPPLSRLKDLLAEKLPQDEQIRLNRHLESCSHCQFHLERLLDEMEDSSDLAKQLHQPPPREPALEKIIDSLKREHDPNQTSDQPAAADLPLGFLSPSAKPDQLGRLGPYEVLAEIGRGGMGIVLKAFDPTLHRVVAIKVLAPQLATSGVARKRFMREAQAVAAVTHDHIVTIHAVEEANGLPYLVMQYIPGQSLQDRIDKEGPLPLKEILRIGMQTAAGLAAAHAQGIVHRDIKPANILLENGVQRVKLTDFGLARAIDDASLTQSGFVAGSPQYMAPEQARGETLDYRADLFSLGSVLYTMCTGRPPFRAANTFAVLRRVSEETPRPIREVNPEIPDWLVAVVDKLHAKDPVARYQSAGEVAEVLGRHLAELQQASYVTPPLPAPKPAAAAEPNGLLTSLTICPNCAAELHVPEKMVGGTVHCPECGKPFRVEEGSEEIHVARAVKPAPAPPFRSRQRISVWPWALVGILVLFFLVCLGIFSLYRVGYTTMQPHAASVVTSDGPWTNGGVEAPLPRKPWPEFWRDALSWFPENATLFGAVDLRQAQPGNATPAVLNLVMPAGVRQVLTAEELWRLGGLDELSFAYYFDPEKPERSRQLLRLRYGSALGTRQKLLAAIRRTVPDVEVEEGALTTAPAGRPARMVSPHLPFALGLLDDADLFLAGYRGVRPDGTDPVEVLERVFPFDFSGSHSPVRQGRRSPGTPVWQVNALKDVPRDVVGLVRGEITPDLGTFLSEKLGLQECPRNVMLYLKCGGKGLELHTTLKVATPGAEQVLLRNLRFLSDAGFTALFPPEMKSRAVVQRWLNALSGTTVRWDVGNGFVQGQMNIPYRNLNDLGGALAPVGDQSTVQEARAAAEGILNDLLAGKLDNDPQLGRLPAKVQGFRSWSIESQELKSDNPRAVTFRGTLTGAGGEAHFTLLLVKQADDRWAIGSFGGPNPK